MDGRGKKVLVVIIVLRYPGMDTVRHIACFLKVMGKSNVQDA